MRRVIACTFILVLTLAACVGCGGTSKDDGSAAGTSTSQDRDTDQGSTTDGSDGSDGGDVPSEEDRDDTDGGGGDSGGGGGEDERVIEIGGPTLDNTFPTLPFALPRPNTSSCVIFTNNESDVAVTVHSVRLVDQQPADDPGLVLGDDPSSHPQCQEHFYPSGLEDLTDSCVDAVLEPDGSTGCPLAVGSTGEEGSDYLATLVLELSASCEDRSGTPCSELPGDAAPSSDDPVTVTWTVTRKYTSCLVPREREGEFSEEETRGECPAVPSETEPSEEPETQPESEPSSEPSDGIEGDDG